MPTTRKQFHEVLLEKIPLAGWDEMEFFSGLMMAMPIDHCHEDIIGALEAKKDGKWNGLIELMIQVAQAQKIEADARKAEQANLVPVGDKLLAMEELLLKMSPRCVKNGLTGDEARDAGKYFLELNGAIVRIYICQTRQDLREEYKVALALIEKLSKR